MHVVGITERMHDSELLEIAGPYGDIHMARELDSSLIFELGPLPTALCPGGLMFCFRLSTYAYTYLSVFA